MCAKCTNLERPGHNTNLGHWVFCFGHGPIYKKNALVLDTFQIQIYHLTKV